MNKPLIRIALQAALALTAAPAGFTVADPTAKICAMTGQQDYTASQAGYDLRKLRGKDLVGKLGRTRRYRVPTWPPRTLAALLALRDQVIAPILAGIRSHQRRGRKPAIWTAVDRDYENLRISMPTLFENLGIHVARYRRPASTNYLRSRNRKGPAWSAATSWGPPPAQSWSPRKASIRCASPASAPACEPSSGRNLKVGGGRYGRHRTQMGATGPRRWYFCSPNLRASRWSLRTRRP